MVVELLLSLESDINVQSVKISTIVLSARKLWAMITPSLKSGKTTEHL